ncbi:metallophosphoesterase [Defluviimonas salinarum]|uniref:Metallophosphoesterase n=1 Tax=Defluviimonas salinarum TaxID=2992147 RepID=A0ABT3J7D7_9RHOB|nr:metallophosphoesterase [Defluviimonas salinarum]MCW3783583.1 metallophosphoesterase [Defluviimonas salinarum]
MNHEHLTTSWRVFPGETEVPDHLFAIADVHGRDDLLESLLARIAKVPLEARLSRTLIFTGDLIDRGRGNLRAIRLALAAEQMADKRVILPGNHELMMLEAIENRPDSGHLRCWYENGGYAVLDEIPAANLAPQAEIPGIVRAALPEGFVDLIDRAPTHHVCGDLILVHAGLAPIGDRAAHLGQPHRDSGRHHWAWIREPFLGWRQGWDPEGAPRKTVVVHGHTVETRLRIGDEQNLFAEVDKVADMARINLDIGAVFFGQMVALEAKGNRYRFHLVTENRFLP